MQRDVLSKPPAVCDVCSALSKERRAVNNRCRGIFAGGRCPGTFKVPTGRLWNPCGPCGATGKAGSFACRVCNSFGWRLRA